MLVSFLLRCTQLPGDLDVLPQQPSPSIPSAPVITVVAGDGSATISWADVSGANTYNLYYTKGASVDKTTGIRVANANSGQTLTGLKLGNQYAFALSAVNKGGESELSATQTIRLGLVWTAANSGLTNLVVQALAVNGGDLLAGTGGGIFLSADSGQTWSPTNTGLTSLDVKSLAANNGNIFAGTGGGVFVSTNNGQSWNIANSGLGKDTAWSLAVSGGNVLAGTREGGLFLSANNGASWTLEDSSLWVWCFSSTIGTVFAACVNGVFLSTNSGTSWSNSDTLAMPCPWPPAEVMSGLELWTTTPTTPQTMA